METIQTDTTHEQLREAIRSYAFDLKLPLVRRDIDLLIQQAVDEQWSMWTFTAELLRREKENRSENQRRHRIKNAGFPQLRYRRPATGGAEGASCSRDTGLHKVRAQPDIVR